MGSGNRETYKLVRQSLAIGIKTYSVYDGSDRLTEFYEAAIDAENGDRALKTTYTYWTTTTLVKGSKEELSAWDTSWLGF